MAAGFLPTLFLRKQRSPIMIKGTLEQLSTGRAISNKVEEQFAEGSSIKAFKGFIQNENSLNLNWQNMIRRICIR